MNARHRVSRGASAKPRALRRFMNPLALGMVTILVAGVVAIGGASSASAATGTYTVSVGAPTSVVVGVPFTYTITFTNTGQAAVVPTITDNLSGDVDDASYDNDATATLGSAPTLTGSTLTWSGRVPAGQAVLISYSVTVKPIGSGDGKLLNTVIAADTGGGNCTTAGDAGCTTRSTVLPTPVVVTPPSASTVLAFTGENVLDVGLVGLLLALCGSGLLVLVRRRNTQER